MKFFKHFVFLITLNFLPSSYGAINIAQGFADIIEPVMPAVVNISTTQKKKSSSNRGQLPFPEGSPLDELFEKLLPPGAFDEESYENQKLVSLGSGFIIDSTGYIVTNYHVLFEADEVTIKLSNGKELKAKIIGGDKKTDLALLKVEHNKPLPFVKFGNSDASRVGDWVVTIGNPFGLGNTATSGIISANGRDIASEGIVDNFIQTDAAINRGNSGGPMLNIHGEVIGINTVILSPSGGNIGIGFATPSSIAKPVIDQLKATGKIRRGVLGVKMQAMTDDIAESLNISHNKGALVVEVMKGSAAAKAGIEVGDIITSFNGHDIKTTKELARVVGNAPIGKEVPLSIFRNGKEKTLNTKLIEDEKDDNVVEKFSEKLKKFSQSANAKDIMGVYVAKIDTPIREKFNIPASITSGLVIIDINRKSSWAARGLLPGDIIVSANGVMLSAVDQLEKVIKNTKLAKKKFVSLLVNKGGNQFFIPVPVE